MYNKKCLTNEDTDDEFDKKAYLKCSGLKQKIISGQV